MHRVLVNGVEDAGVPGDDPGLLLGLTVFDTLRTYGSHVFRLDAHLDRLEASARQMGIGLPSRDLIRGEILANVIEDARIRYTVTAGGNRVLDTAPLDAAQVSGPIRVAPVRWDPPDWLPGAVKHGSRASWILAAQRLQVDEVLLVDSGGNILEANRSNVFAVIDGMLCTPPLDGRCLEGVTRRALLDAAAASGLSIVERPVLLESSFDELYLSSTLKELAPVVQMGSGPGPGGGPMGKQLRAAFRTLVKAEIGQ